MAELSELSVMVDPEAAMMEPGIDLEKVAKEKLEAWRTKIKDKVDDYKREIKSKDDPHYKPLGIPLPSAFGIFLRSNTDRFKILIRSLQSFPVEFAIHFMHEYHKIAVVLFIGFLCISVWMAFEEIAIYGKEQVLVTILDTINALAIFEEVIISLIATFILGPVVEILQFFICQDVFGLGSNTFPSNKGGFYDIVCNDLPGFGNRNFWKNPIDVDKYAPAWWDYMRSAKTTCAEFSTGLEELQVMPKLFLSPFICPILQYVRPIPWLYDMFWYTLGWATWSQGIEKTYEAPWASAVTNMDTTHGLHNNRKCEAPPDALFCFILGFGFLVGSCVLVCFS